MLQLMCYIYDNVTLMTLCKYVTVNVLNLCYIYDNIFH